MDILLVDHFNQFLLVRYIGLHRFMPTYVAVGSYLPLWFYWLLQIQLPTSISTPVDLAVTEEHTYQINESLHSNASNPRVLIIPLFDVFLFLICLWSVHRFTLIHSAVIRYVLFWNMSWTLLCYMESTSIVKKYSYYLPFKLYCYRPIKYYFSVAIFLSRF